ncbi:MAG: glycosyl transferase [Clostridiales bacterium]|nr:glycosyl transferase [Clostridiales bacterium]
MIPKIIHYCWFGGNPLPALAVKCIESWKKYCPDYEIKEWNESNFDINYNAYTKEAYMSKKWAFVSDVARLYVIYNHGGIYMDTDVEVIKPLDDFLNNHAFSGFELPEFVSTGIIGCEQNFKLIKEFLGYYDCRKFITEDGNLDLTTNVKIITEIMSNYGLIKNNNKQTIKGFELYPTEYFCPKDYSSGKLRITANTFTIHHFCASWQTDEQHKAKKRLERYVKIFGPKLGIRLDSKIKNAKYIYKVAGINGVIAKIKESSRKESK